MIHHRQQFDVSEPQALQVVGQLWRQLLIGERTVTFMANTSPRAQMHLVDCHRLIEPVAAMAIRHPVGVTPDVIEIPDNRRGLWWNFVEDGEGISLVHSVTLKTGGNVLLVERTLANAGKKTFPDSRL